MGYGWFTVKGKTKKESKEKFQRMRILFSITWLDYGKKNGYLVEVSGKTTKRVAGEWITSGHFDK